MDVSAPTIVTERLVLRPYDESDAPNVVFYADPDVMRFIPRGAWDRSGLEAGFLNMLAHQRERWARQGFGMWAIELKSTGALIGHCGLQPLPDSDEIEVFYLLDRPFWNRGLGTEAAYAALTFGFDRAGLARIVAIAMHENVGSQRIMEKAGMSFVGRAHHYGIDCVKYAKTRDPAEKGGDERVRIEPVGP